MYDTQTTLLVAEHGDAPRQFLLDNLSADGYEPTGAQTEQEARLKLRSHAPSLLLLGGLPGERSRLELLRAIRSGAAGPDPGMPVIVLGCEGGEPELLRAFEAGCDHFLCVPFSYLELRARVRACIQRAQDWRIPNRLVIGALEIDQDARRVFHAGRELWLSRLEYELLAHLATAPTRVFTKAELLRDVWGFRLPGNTRTVDAHACRLRRKLARAGAPHLIQTARGVGYRLSVGSVPTLETQRPAPLSLNGHAA